MNDNLPQEDHYVYIFCHSENRAPIGPVKVGVSGNFEKRLRTLRTANPRKIHVLCVISTPNSKISREIERDFHAANSGARLEGEWFDLEPYEAASEMCSLVRSHLERYSHPDWLGGLLNSTGVADIERVVTPVLEARRKLSPSVLQ